MASDAPQDPQRFDIVIIGGGSGLTAAWYAQKDGLSVALVDRLPDALGGTCVNRGCIPTKQLIQTAEVMKTIREAERFGITLDQDSVKVDYKQVSDAMRTRRRKAAGGTRVWVDEAFTPFYGHAHFVDDKVLEMDDGRRLTGDKIFLCNGARAVIPAIPGLDALDYWTNVETLEQDKLPDSVVILGAGYIGAEFAHLFATLGSRVTMIGRADIVGGEDDDVRALFRAEMEKKIDLRLGVGAKEAIRRDGKQGFLVEDDDGNESELLGDAVIVAVGRRPNTDELGLDKTGVETDENGWVQADAHLRTTHPDIYAYGDVIGQAMFKHTSSYEGELAYRNSRGGNEEVSYHANPHAVFTDPQIGGVGLTEQECKDQGLRYKVSKKDYDDVAKGEIIGHPAGFAKVIVEEDTDRILGFHVVGPHAAILVHEVVVAMNAGAGKAELVRKAIHIHPSMPELVHTVFSAV